MSSPKSDYLTPAEYLELERKAETRSEYIDRRMYAMSPGSSKEHNFISGNLYAAIKTQLRGRPCAVFLPDMRVKVSPTGMYTYPDVTAVCGESKFEDAHVDTLLNPTVIIEVLSDSTEKYDRGEKFAHYRTLDSLQEYVLVSQEKVQIDHYVRESGRWMFSAINSLDAHLTLPSIRCEIVVRDVYENVFA